MKILELNLEGIKKLCLKYRVAKLWVFGSILSSNFNEDSDIDLLVVFDKARIALLEMADLFFDFVGELEMMLGRKVDLTEYDAITNHYFKEEVDEKKQLLWSAE